MEIGGYLKVLKYRKQGLKNANYYTLPGLISEMTKAAKSGDPFSTMKKRMSTQDPNQPFGVINFATSCMVTLISEKAIKDFYAQEVEVTTKQRPFKNIDFLGFFFENGAHVQDKRAIFSKVFHYSNVLNLMPSMRNVIRQHVQKLKKRVVGEGGELKIDVKTEFNRALLDDLSACILLRGARNKIAETFDGMNVPQIVQQMTVTLNSMKTNLLTLVPFSTNLGLVKEIKEMKRLKEGLTGIIRNEYNRRYNEETLDDKSVLDIMVKLNKESEKETGKAELTIDEITSNFELFQVAASDTSYHLSSSILTYLALPENQEYQKRLLERIDSELGANESYSNDELNAVKEMDWAFKEGVRVVNPASGVARVATKNFKVDGKTIFKGDMVINTLINFEKKYFKDPFKFNPDRFDTKKDGFKRAPKLKQTPFSVGKRACLGKYLGEMVVTSS